VSARWSLLALMLALNAVFGVALFRFARRRHFRADFTAGDIALGLAVSFFDTLGIGSYAPSTSAFKLRGRPADELIPGTLTIGLNASGLVETLIFVTAVLVDPALLVATVGAGAVGAWLGAGVVSRLPRRAIQLCMGCALLVGASMFAATNLGALPASGMSMSLAGWRFDVAVAVNFVLGGLLSAGIGSYAPSMIVLSLLGLNPLGAFPIMVATCGVGQPMAGLRFLKSGRFDWGVCVGMSCGGVFGVLLAAYVVKSLPLVALRWLVVGVVLYAAAAMLQSARGERVQALPAG
jgi:uncharacterized membrane protein YfcA